MSGPSRFLLGALAIMAVMAVVVVFWPHPAQGQVIDGDTFIAAGERIRIADINTPEMNGRCAGERLLALRARNRLQQLLRQPYRLQRLGRDRDRYGRLLRVVVRISDGRSVGDVLVSEGLARTWTGRREPWC